MSNKEKPVENYDYIVVGAGSSGCVVANRLSENPSHRVLLLEAGGKDQNPWIHIPVGYFKTMHNPSTDWCYRTEPDPGISGRSLQWPRGKVLGGSSSLNGLLYVRGQPQDYDHWMKLGNHGWSYEDVLPYFKVSEDQQHGESRFHGTGGPQKVSDLRLRRPIAEKFIAAAVECGIPYNPDCNGEIQEGVGYFQQTAYKGFRWSTAKGFLRPAMKRANLKLRTRAHVLRLQFTGKRASGIQYQHRGEIHTAQAKSEIVLCAGSINSPQLLQCSGIGDPALLNSVGIEPVHSLIGVGQNLQDHLQIRLVYKTVDRTLNDELNHPLKMLGVGLQYLLTRTGPMTLAASQVYIFTRSVPDLDRPDIQFHMQPLSADKPGEGVHPFSAFTSSVCQLRPWSRGEVRIKSKDPLEYPEIHPKYLSDVRDCRVAVNAIKCTRRIASTPSLASSLDEEFIPGPQYQTDEEILHAAREFSQTIYHPVGTCKMGNDPLAVVDHELKVHGIDGLRVADASIMPTITSGNTNAPCIMIGEKAASMILNS
ncbi:MAG: choline dehydrogenase [Gammaproteobacteria bacterium]|nr:choline dehydrogenase [Gammaproteobacteria bacterium]MCY4218742.1 choline dehydrogenase [Gammaproteobacteria bacterium]